MWPRCWWTYQNNACGDVGTVIEVFAQTDAHPAGFIVEFVDESGAVCAQADITDAAQLMRLHFNFKREAA